MGGFAGGPGGWDTRDWVANPTILDGDIGESGVHTDNAYHVVVGADGAILDGFTITNGNATGDDYDWIGGGVYLSTGTMAVAYCIFWGNTASEAGSQIYRDGSLEVLISHSDIQGCGGSGTGWDSSLGTDGGGNIDADSLFVDASDPDGPDDTWLTYDDGLRLLASSPCIDAADGDAATATDILGHLRVDVPSTMNTGTGTPAYADIGAYEFVLMGDANHDGWVDDNDLSLLLSHWKQGPVGWPRGDFSGDGNVEDSDLSSLLEHWTGMPPREESAQNLLPLSFISSGKPDLFVVWAGRTGVPVQPDLPLAGSDSSWTLLPTDDCQMRHKHSSLAPVGHRAGGLVQLDSLDLADMLADGPGLTVELAPLTS